MMIALALALGVVWGVLAALLGMLVMKRAMRTQNGGAFLAANFGRTVLDLGSMVLVYLLRNLLEPLPWSFVLIGTAVSLSLTMIVTSFRMAGKGKS